MIEPENNRQTKPHYRKMTVAHIRETSRADSVEVMFLESARFYRLLRNNPAFDNVLKRLRDAMTRRQVLDVEFSSQDSEIIESLNEV